MSDKTIIINSLGKQYRIGALQKKGEDDTLRDLFVSQIKHIGKRLTNATDSLIGSKYFWALKDISFEVEKGDVVGIIGYNGAGKSTLLKILSKITPPTEGSAILQGHVASLLEVSTGFHQELTGRENIYFSGAVLGMRRKEIQRKIDSIIEFSGIDDFIDTPVKRYSSGMLVRLGFSIAAHLEPEILLIDEVLAVGDVQFQKKCLGKMSDVANSGKSILFVSHNMAAVNRLCSRGIVLEKGRLVIDDSATRATQYYYSGGSSSMAEVEWSKECAPGDEVVRLRRVCIIDHQGHVSDRIDIRDPFSINVEYDIEQDGVVIAVIITVIDALERFVFMSPDWNENSWGKKPRKVGKYKAKCQIPGNFMAEGMFSVVTQISTLQPLAKIRLQIKNSIVFQVIDEGLLGSVRGTDWGHSMPGIVRPMLEWSTHHER